MRFTKALTSLLASAALTGFAWGAAIDCKTNTKSVRAPPAPQPLPVIDAQIEDFCGSYVTSTKRDHVDLAARVNAPGPATTLKPGEIGAESIVGLWTEFLVSCTGIAIVGTPRNAGDNSRFMYHTITTQTSFNSEWPAFAAKVSQADLTNPRAVISAMDTTDSEKLPTHYATMTFTENDINELNRVLAIIVGDVKDLIGGADPKVMPHYGLDVENHVGNAGTMYIDMANNIQVDGETVPV
jgi:hypothetical protein